ncbi:hypothetical protein ELH75_34115 [Rhizobium leguminosarum]|uniref:Uncharacterized protein n=1 Tax=Rhizobium leguminosarum TaxID=384 RepID=A0A7M3DTM7_RHILE|nr:hypothetical protein [Rhizobium leguminosarum]TAY52051.1 hypothetical protein ELH90_10460 [Rhizobium leguminosarum]TAZ45919.1 hypothetical protein ELH75_34115 [Rhizobium leguminosarum]
MSSDKLKHPPAFFWKRTESSAERNVGREEQAPRGVDLGQSLARADGGRKMFTMLQCQQPLTGNQAGNQKSMIAAGAFGRCGIS